MLLLRGGARGLSLRLKALESGIKRTLCNKRILNELLAPLSDVVAPSLQVIYSTTSPPLWPHGQQINCFTDAHLSA